MQELDLYAASDTVLLAKISEGNRRAFNVLYDKYWKTVYNAAYKRVNDKEIAEDIAQDIFVQLWIRNTDAIITDLPGYLSIAARNGVFKRMGKEGKYAELPGNADEIQESFDNTDSKILHKEFLKAFLALIDALPDQQRIIFKLRFNENLTSQQIANKLKISNKTVRNHIGRALTTLKKELILVQLLILLCHR